MSRPLTRLVTVAFLLGLTVSELPARTWSDNTGQYKIEGEFVQLAAGHVDLRRDDGKLVRIPLEKLSPADQEYAAKMAGNRVPNPFETRKDESQQEEATVSPPHAVDERTLEVVATGYANGSRTCSKMGGKR